MFEAFTVDYHAEVAQRLQAESRNCVGLRAIAIASQVSVANCTMKKHPVGESRLQWRNQHWARSYNAVTEHEENTQRKIITLKRRRECQWRTRWRNNYINRRRLIVINKQSLILVWMPVKKQNIILNSQFYLLSRSIFSCFFLIS